MAFVRVALGAVLVVAWAVGCSQSLEIAVFNNANETVIAGPTNDKKAIAPGRIGEFLYPGPNEKWDLTLSTTTCVYVYAVPNTFEDYPRSDYRGPFKVQLEQDFVLYLLSDETTTIVDAKDLGQFQKGVFPLRASSKTCW